MDKETYCLLSLLALKWLRGHRIRPSPRMKRAPELEPHIEAVPLPPSFRKRSWRTASIDSIVLHCTEGGGDARKSALHALRPVEEGGRMASFHNVVGRDGEIVQLVPWEQQAWHCSSMPGLLEISWNNRSIGIEICASPKQGMSLLQELALIRLIRYLIRRYSIPVENITAHRFTGANTSCPDSLWCTQKELKQWKQSHLVDG